jgi:hypothetical protein
MEAGDKMKIMQTWYSESGPVQIQDHGLAFVVSYPATEESLRGCQREKVFGKGIGFGAWNLAQGFAAACLKKGTEK